MRQYLASLTCYASIASAALLAGEARRGFVGLSCAWVVTVALAIGYVLINVRPADPLAPFLAVLTAASALAAVAGVVWARRGAQRRAERVLTAAISMLAFFACWFAISYAIVAPG